MEFKTVFKTTILTIFSLGVFSAQTSEVEIPNTFVDGEVTSASEMNANFEAIKAAVNDNYNRIGNGNSPSRVEFLGFTPTTFDSTSGFFAAQQMCHNWIANSYVCRPQEVVDTPYSSSALATIADGEYESALLYQLDTWNSANCNDFTTGSSSPAYIVDSSGRVRRHAHLDCATPRPLACCK